MKIYALSSKHHTFSELRSEKEISCIQHTVPSFLDNYLAVTPFFWVFFQSFLNSFINLKKFSITFECLQYVPVYIVTESWMTCELSVILGLLNYIKRQMLLNSSTAGLSLVLLCCTLFQWIICIWTTENLVASTWCLLLYHRSIHYKKTYENYLLWQTKIYVVNHLLRLHYQSQ